MIKTYACPLCEAPLFTNATLRGCPLCGGECLPEALLVEYALLFDTLTDDWMRFEGMRGAPSPDEITKLRARHGLDPVHASRLSQVIVPLAHIGVRLPAEWEVVSVEHADAARAYAAKSKRD